MTQRMDMRKAVVLAAPVLRRAVRIGELALGSLTTNLAEGIVLPKSMLAVSLEEQCCSVVYGRRHLSDVKIVGWKHQSFEKGGDLQPEPVAAAASLLVRDLKGEAEEVVLVIPKSWVMVRTVDLPASAKMDLGAVISYDFDRHMPLASENALYDFKVIEEKNGRLRIFLVAVREDQISPYVKAFGNKGMRVVRITVIFSALATLFSDAGGFLSGPFVRLGEGGLEGGLVVDGSIVSVTSESLNGDGGSSGKERLLSRISSLGDAARNRGVTSPIFIHTDGGLVAVSEKELGVPVKVLGTRELTARYGNGGDARFPVGAAGGLLEGLRPATTAVNLLSKGTRERKRPPITLTVTMVLLVLLLAGGFMAVPYYKGIKRIQGIDRQIADRKEVVRRAMAVKSEIAGIDKEISAIQGFRTDRPLALDVLRELTTLLPKTVWLVRLRIAENTAELEGYASSAPEIVQRLEESTYFKKVEFASPTIRDNRLNKDKFLLKAELKGVQERKPEAPRK